MQFTARASLCCTLLTESVTGRGTFSTGVEIVCRRCLTSRDICDRNFRVNRRAQWWMESRNSFATLMVLMIMMLRQFQISFVVGRWSSGFLIDRNIWYWVKSSRLVLSTQDMKKSVVFTPPPPPVLPRVSNHYQGKQLRHLQHLVFAHINELLLCNCDTYLKNGHGLNIIIHFL